MQIIRLKIARERQSNLVIGLLGRLIASHDKEVILSSSSPLTEQCIKLSGCRGGFDILPSGRGFRIERPLSCAHDLFISFRKGGWIASDDLGTALDDNQSSSIDQLFIADYLLSPGTVTDRTPFRDATLIPPGTAASLHPDGRCYIERLSFQPPPIIEEAQIPSTLIEYITEHSNETDAIIELSGGLDSTGLLYCALDCIGDPKRLLAVTYYDPFAKDSTDLASAKAVCTRTGVSHKLIPVRDTGIISSLADSDHRPVRPSLSLLHLALQQDFLAQTKMTISAAPILNGHGGDHIFLGAPGASLIIDHLWKAHPEPSHALQTAKKLAVLSQRSWPSLAHSVLVECRKRLRDSMHGTPLLGVNTFDQNTILTDKCKALGLQERLRMSKIIAANAGDLNIRRRYELMEAVHQTSSHHLIDSARRTLYPYLNPKLLACAESIPLADTFTYEFNRCPQRASFYKRYADEAFLRKGKGHISGGIQRMIRAQRRPILDLLLDGHAMQLGLVQERDIRKEIESCCIGGGSLSRQILQLVALEAYFRQWQRVARRAAT